MSYASFILPLSIHILCIVVAFGLVHLLPLSGPYEFFKTMLSVCWLAFNLGIWCGTSTSELRILPASKLRELYTLLFIFRLHQCTNLSCFDSLVNLRSMIHNYDTRSSGEINIPLIVSTRLTFSVLHRGIRSWNNLGQTFKNYSDFSFFQE